MGGDSGTAEREQGLLQLLCEMDGFRQNDRVLVIGATNMCAWSRARHGDIACWVLSGMLRWARTRHDVA